MPLVAHSDLLVAERYGRFERPQVPELYMFSAIRYVWRPPVWYIWLAQSVGERESRGWWAVGTVRRSLDTGVTCCDNATLITYHLLPTD